MLESEARNVASQLDVLVLSRQITPAVRDKAAALLSGTETARPAIMLSRKAATAAGMKSAVAQQFIDVLKELPKPEGSGKTISMSREVNKEDKIDQAAIDNSIRLARGVSVAKK